MQTIFKIPQTKQSLPTRGMRTSTKQWIAQKQQRDVALWHNQQKLWIIENKAYDLSEYVQSHPGGRQWILLTKGQDITQHFIIHHLNQAKARSVLAKYYVRQANKPQQPRFTFEKDGLYRSIKDALLEQYKPEHLQNWNNSQADGTILLTIWAILFCLTSYFESYLLAILCGFSIYPLIGVAHNFIHMKLHLFRYLFLLTGFTHQQWQEMHCISHHVYSNTLLDYQIQGLEPLVYYLKIHPQNTILNGIIKELLFPFAALLSMISRLLFLPVINQAMPEWFSIVPFLQIPFMYFVNGDIYLSMKLFCVMQISFSTFFMKINFFGHRTGKQWTEGNEQIRDFAEHQILSCTDTKTNDLCGFLSYVCFAGFNFHGIHHLFPTIDNHHLPKADKIMKQQAEKFGIKKNEISSWVEGLYEIQSNFYHRKEWKRP